MCREGLNFLVRGDRPDDSVVAEPWEGVTDQHWLALCAPWEGGEAGADLRPEGSGKRRRRRRGIEPR